MERSRFLLLLCATPLVAGCYNYTQVDLQAVAPGEDVRLFVTPEGAREVEEVSSTDTPVPVVQGALEGREGGAVLLRVPLPRASPVPSRAMEQRVRIPEEAVLSAERRTLDGWATAALTVGAVALGVGVVFGIIEAWGSGSDNPDDGPVVFFGVPIG